VFAKFNFGTNTTAKAAPTLTFGILEEISFNVEPLKFAVSTSKFEAVGKGLETDGAVASWQAIFVYSRSTEIAVEYSFTPTTSGTRIAFARAVKKITVNTRRVGQLMGIKP